jgi:hypothetical protein
MVEVKQSLIKGAGRGVFATKDINEGERVCEYWGKYIDLKKTKFPSSDKLLQIDESTLFCGYEKYKKPDKCGQFINDSSSIDNINVGSIRKYHHDNFANVDISIEAKGIYFNSIKNIKEGDELYFKYGINYWIQKFDKKNVELLLKNNRAFLLSLGMHELIQPSNT